ncbi:MAG: hypothetical protein M0Z69_01735 [Actinomycetota bacterium]|nr:hypothetical protein [Actinomycetota bacterium]
MRATALPAAPETGLAALLRATATDLRFATHNADSGAEKEAPSVVDLRLLDR